VTSDVSVEKIRVLARLKPQLTAAEKRLPQCLSWTDETITLTEPSQQVRATHLPFANGYFFLKKKKRKKKKKNSLSLLSRSV
jgi:hypothetical protein